MAQALSADEVFRTLFEYCSRKPAATVDHPWGEVVFKVKKKIFAYIGRPGEASGVTVKPAPEELQELLARPNIALAHYIGRYGWVHVSIGDRASLQLAERLIDETYEQIAHRKKPERVTAPSSGEAGPAPKKPPAKKADAAEKKPASAKKAESGEKKPAEKKPAARKPASAEKAETKAPSRRKRAE
jgi:predicted DNA-binding protein (MmcQ/YjbR family)